MLQLKPFKEILKMSKEAIDDALAPVRARSAKAKATLEVSKLEERMIALETEIHNLCAEKELDFPKIADKMDAYALTERRHKQIESIVEQLFPSKEQEINNGDS